MGRGCKCAEPNRSLALLTCSILAFPYENGEHASRKKSSQPACCEYAACKTTASCSMRIASATLVRAECLHMRIQKLQCNMLAAKARTNHNARRMLSDVCILATSLRDACRKCRMHTLLQFEKIKDQHEKKFDEIVMGFVDFLGLISSHMYMLYRSPGFKIPLSMLKAVKRKL